ncbi:unnamed protein product, partial [Notodromas monacha]
ISCSANLGPSSKSSKPLSFIRLLLCVYSSKLKTKFQRPAKKPPVARAAQMPQEPRNPAISPQSAKLFPSATMYPKFYKGISGTSSQRETIWPIAGKLPGFGVPEAFGRRARRGDETLTAAVSLAQVREPPHVAQADRHGNHAGQKLGADLPSSLPPDVTTTPSTSSSSTAEPDEDEDEEFFRSNSQFPPGVVDVVVVVVVVVFGDAEDVPPTSVSSVSHRVRGDGTCNNCGAFFGEVVIVHNVSAAAAAAGFCGHSQTLHKHTCIIGTVDTDIDSSCGSKAQTATSTSTWTDLQTFPFFPRQNAAGVDALLQVDRHNKKVHGGGLVFFRYATNQSQTTERQGGQLSALLHISYDEQLLRKIGEKNNNVDDGKQMRPRVVVVTCLMMFFADCCFANPLLFANNNSNNNNNATEVEKSNNLDVNSALINTEKHDTSSSDVQDLFHPANPPRPTGIFGFSFPYANPMTVLLQPLRVILACVYCSGIAASALLRSDYDDLCSSDKACESGFQCINKMCIELCLEQSLCHPSARCYVLSTKPVRTMICLCPPGTVTVKQDGSCITA